MTITTMTTTLRVGLYGRLSSERAAETSTSVEDQLAYLRRWAAEQGHRVVKETRDDGLSASRFARKKERPGFEQAMELITAGLIDILAVWALPRASRDRLTYALLIAACIDHGVLICIGGKVHDPADPDDALHLDLQSLLAVNGSARISKDVKRAVDSRAERGAPHGRLAFGYRIEYDPQTGKPARRVIDPVNGPIVKEIADRLLAGETAYGIAKDFNARGLVTQTGKEWRGQNITKAMRSPTIAGLRVHRGEIAEGVEAEWEPILSRQDFDRVCALLADPTRKTNHEGSQVKHLGSGIYRCGVCDGVMRVISGYRASGTRRIRYTCHSSFCVQRATDLTDEVVELAMVTFLSRPDIYRLLADDGDTGAEEARAEAAHLRAEMMKLRQKVDAGDLGLEDLAYFRAKWEPRIQAADERSRPKTIPTVVFDVAGPEAEARWKATPILGRRAIIKALVDVKVMPVGGRSNTFDPEAIQVTRKKST